MSNDKWPPDALEIRGAGLEQFNQADLRDLRKFLGRRALNIEPVYDPITEVVQLTPDYVEEMGDDEEWFINRSTFRKAGEISGYNPRFVSSAFSKIIRMVRPVGSVLRSKDEEKDEEQMSLDVGRNVDKIRVILPGEKPDLELDSKDALLSLHGLCNALMDRSLHTTVREPTRIGEKSVMLIEDVVRQFVLPEHRQ